MLRNTGKQSGETSEYKNNKIYRPSYAKLHTTQLWQRCQSKYINQLPERTVLAEYKNWIHSHTRQAESWQKLCTVVLKHVKLSITKWQTQQLTVILETSTTTVEILSTAAQL